MGLFRRRRHVLEHPYFGTMRFTPGGYWEAELDVPGAHEKVGVTVPADEESGPSEQQVAFCRALIADPDGLFERCRPVFESVFEEWAGRPLPSDWRRDFSLVALGLPEAGDEARPWDVGYFVDAANHYFTAYFEGGGPSYVTVDG